MHRWLAAAAAALLAMTNTLAAAAAGLEGPSSSAADSGDRPLFSMGLIADIQYCDADPGLGGVRHYRASTGKLQECVRDLNGRPLAFTVQLGDLIDRDVDSFAVILPVLNKLQAPIHHVLGNHDFSVAEDKKASVPAILGMPGRYYGFAAKGWRFLVLDGNAVSLQGTAPGDPERQEAERTLERLRAAQRPNAQTYNGALGAEQLEWLAKRLDAAETRGEPVVLFCHFPAFPENVHNLWDDAEVTTLLASHPNVVAFICGHNHAGGYGRRDGVHYLTLQGMVDTPDQTAYAVADVYPDRIEIRGEGRVPSRTLRFRERAGAKK